MNEFNYIYIIDIKYFFYRIFLIILLQLKQLNLLYQYHEISFIYLNNNIILFYFYKKFKNKK